MATSPASIGPHDWQRIEAQITNEVDAAIVAGNPGRAKGGITDAHGLVRTDVVTGDYADLPPQTSEFGPEFGYSVDIDGDWLVVGAPGTVSDDEVRGVGEYGMVFLFRRSAGNWILHQRMLAATGYDNRCGESVAIRYPEIAIGCPAKAASAGGASNGEVQLWSITNEPVFRFRINMSFSSSDEDRECGSAVALTRNYLAVGCPGEDEAGRVDIYRKIDSNYSNVPEASISGVPLDTFGFGSALAMYEPTPLAGGPQNVRLAIGAPSTIYAGDIFPRGTVHIYHRALTGTNWNANTVLRLSEPGEVGNALAQFGAALAMSRTQLVVGAPNNRYGAIDDLPGPGSVHRYEYTEFLGNYAWRTRESGGALNLQAGPHQSMRHGQAVAIAHENLIVVGAPGTNGQDSGGDVAEGVGLVEFWRTAGGDWSVFNYQGQVRPGPLNPLARDEGRFGHSLATDTGEKRLVVGYPYSGVTIATGGEPSRPSGAAWIYAPEGSLVELFSDGFE